MSIVEEQDLQTYCLDTARRAKDASAKLALVTGAAKNEWLKESARRIRERQADIIAANEQDVAAAPNYGLTDAQVDRFKAG